MNGIILRNRKAIGDEAEEVAARHLAAHGLRVVARNFRVKGGELDLVCTDGKTTVFVEVRRRAGADSCGRLPQESSPALPVGATQRSRN
jgi:Holliday junction resolvase-like predicted endonuclease